MTSELQQTLAEHARQRDRVSLSRDEIDEHRLHGYVLAVSAELVLIQHVYDFNLDGLRVLRLQDITEVECSDTDRFQKAMTVADGLEQFVPFGQSFELGSWRAILGQLSRDYPLMILEGEAPEDEYFAIGRLRELTQDDATFDTFDSLGVWSDAPDVVDYDELTCCQVDSAYLNAYQRHFERMAGT